LSVSGGVLKKLAASALFIALAPGIAGAEYDLPFLFPPGSGVTSEDVGSPDDPGGGVGDSAGDAADGVKDWLENIAETLVGNGIGALIDKIKAGSGGEQTPEEKEEQEKAAAATSANPDSARFIFDLAIFATLMPDAAQATETMAVEQGRRDDYIERWDKDHSGLGSGIFSRAANQFDASALASAMRGGGSVTYGANPGASAREKAPGMRGGTNIIYSDAYKARRDMWRGDMEGVLKANRSQTKDIHDNARNLIRDMDSASDGAYGYLETMQAGAAAANYLNTAFLAARADMARRADVQLRAWLEKIQDDADEVSAFEQAVSTWNGAGTSTGTGH
jgi:hypothetical protein